MMNLPLKSTQQGIFLGEFLNDTPNLYKIAHCIEISVKLNIPKFITAIQTAVNEADSVIADYATQANEPNFTLRQTREISVQVIQVTDPEAQKQKWIFDYIQNQSIACTLKQKDHLIQQILFVAPDKIYWYQQYHHIMLDGFSLDRLTARVFNLYDHLKENKPIKQDTVFTPLTPVLDEYQHYIESQAYINDQQFWQDYTKNFSPPISLSDSLTPPNTTANFLRHLIIIDSLLLEKIDHLAQEHTLTRADLLMALSLLYLSKMTHKQHLVVGIPFMRRLGSKALKAALPTVNVLPVQFKIYPTSHWLEIAQKVKEEIKKIRPHQRYDAEQVLRDLKAVDFNQPLYGPILNYKGFNQHILCENEPIHTHYLSSGPVDDFEFSFINENNQFVIELRADAKRYTPHSLKEHGVRLSYLLEQVFHQPFKASQYFPITSPFEQKQLNSFSKGQNVTSSYRHILEIFFEQAKQYPNRIALVGGTQTKKEQLTFLALSQKIHQFTQYLRQKGIQKNQVVAVAIPRSIDTVIAMLSILNSGATFLPIDLDYPLERIEMMCEDTQPKLILTQSHLKEKLPSHIPHIYLDTHKTQTTLDQYPNISCYPPIQILPDDIAYVIFTSGSTGRPKGVMNTHGALLNLILAHQHTIFFPTLEKIKDRPLRASHTHSFSFDSSWEQIFWLIWGQELHIFDETIRRDAYALVKEIQTRKIDALDLPPSFCAQLIANGLFDEGQHQPSLILIGGEAAPLALWKQLKAQPNLSCYNLYGPTEYTVDTFYADVTKTDEPVIGLPIANTTTYVLDSSFHQCPIGVIGELYISGLGLAAGYVGRGDLTSTRFVANPFLDGKQMYRTGDLVRWNQHGQLEFIGRSDDQVKIRGYRVEIGEVENAISLLDQVESTIVIAQAIHQTHRLIGYCVVRDTQDKSFDEWSTYYLAQLQARLPDYMVPSALIVMSEFPRNMSGKIDKNALPTPFTRKKIQAPETKLEQVVVHHIQKVLQLDHVDVEDHFFAIGGDSISAIMLCTALRKSGYSLQPSHVFKYKTPRLIATYITPLISAQHEQLNPLVSSSSNMIELPLLPLQKGMLFHSQLEDQKDDAGYQAYTKILFDGILDAKRLQHAFNQVLIRHPQLSGYFNSHHQSEPVFSYTSKPLKPWTVHVCDKNQDTQIQIPVANLNQENGLICAVLGQDILNKNSELIISIHHLITDGWSTPIFLQDLFSYYANPNIELLPLSTPYHQVVQQLVSRSHQQSLTFWQEDLKNCQSLILFKDQKLHQPVIESSYCISQPLTQRLFKKLKETGITLNVYMQMIWALWLSQYSHRSQIVFGTPVSGRSSPISGLDEHIGLFLNTIPVHIQLQPHTDIWTQLHDLQALHSERMEHDHLSLSDLQGLTQQAQLFDQLLVVENYPDASYQAIELPDVKIKQLINRGYSHYPLALLVIPHTDKIEFLLEQRDVISQPKILLSQLEQWIEFSLSNTNERLSRYPLSTPAHHQHIQRINSTDQAVVPTTLQVLLRQSYQQYAHQTALFNDEQTLTYQEVQRRVLTIASDLQHQHHAQAGDLIAVCLPRSIELSLTILAIIELGACYLPIDPTFPNDRIHTILEDAVPTCMVTEFDHIHRFSIPHIIDIAQVQDYPYQPNQVIPQSPAYLIYTSGTIGKPKGVLVSHQAIVNRLTWMQAQYPLQYEDTILQKTPCTFDVSVWEFFWSYLVGAKLAIAPESSHRDPEQLIHYIQKYHVTVIHFVPSMLAIFTSTVQNTKLPLKYVFCSGEALPTRVVQQFKSVCSAPVYNLYGPTEAAVDVSYFDANQPSKFQDHTIPIGFPVWNTQLYILDQYLRPVEIGIDGELYISGDQLAMGYLNRADLNCSCFVANPFLDGKQMYKTGDIAHYNADGSIQYVGRTDHQLKIRGQRIELGEIEAQIKALIDVEDVRVQALSLVSTNNHTDERQLVAYLQNKQPIEKTALFNLKKQLKQHLPAYMLPVTYVCLPQFPLSHNGKLDLKALPSPDLTPSSTQQYARTLVEKEVEAIFQDLLQIQRRIGVNEDFFSLGGHSILVMKMAIEIKKKFDISISMQYLMSHANIEKLSNVIQRQDLVTQANEVGLTPTLTIREAKTPPIFCFSPGSGSAWQYSILNSYLHSEISIIGFQSPRPHGPLAISQSIDEVADSAIEQMLKIQPQGPYFLLGYSLGGTVAFCVAEKLQALGHVISFLGLLDTYPAEIHPWDEEVNNDDIEQEQLHFFEQVFEETDSALHAEKQALQDIIFANYEDAVRLLKVHKTQKTNLNLDVFVAKKSLPDYVQPEKNWRPYVKHVQIHELEEAMHENILSPEHMTILGPLLNQKLCTLLNISMEGLQ